MKSIRNENTKQDSNKSIILQIICFSIKHRRIMQCYLDKTGVYQAQHRLLMKISNDRNVSQKALAAAFEVSTSTIAVSLKKLEKGGYIKRETDTGDNRFNRITITEKGLSVIEQSKQIFSEADEKLFEGFSDEEKNTLAFLLQKLDNNLSKMEEELKS